MWNVPITFIFTFSFNSHDEFVKFILLAPFCRYENRGSGRLLLPAQGHAACGPLASSQALSPPRTPHTVFSPTASPGLLPEDDVTEQLVLGQIHCGASPLRHVLIRTRSAGMGHNLASDNWGHPLGGGLSAQLLQKLCMLSKHSEVGLDGGANDRWMNIQT